MAHVYLMTCMPQWVRNVWLANMMSASSPWKRELLDKKGKPSGKFEDTNFAWNIKPIELWEVVVPKENVNEVLWYNGINGPKQVDDGIKGATFIKKMIQKKLGLKDIPDYMAEHKKKKEKFLVKPRMIYREGARIYGLGVKDDEVKEFPQWGYKQEAL